MQIRAFKGGQREDEKKKTMAFHADLNLVFPSRPLVFPYPLSFLFIPNLEIQAPKALSAKFKTYLSRDVMILEVGVVWKMFTSHDEPEAWWRRGPADDQIKISPDAFCEDHNLTVSSTGKTRPIKKDYVTAVWLHVSENIERQDKITDKSKILHRMKDCQTCILINRRRWLHRLSIREKTLTDPWLSARRLTIWLKRPSHCKCSIRFDHKWL